MLALLALAAAPAAAQQVVIQRATPELVVEAMTRLLPDGFKLESADKKKAQFTLDRGMVSQRQGPARHVTLELNLRFRERPQGLEVTATEDVVSTASNSADFRQRVVNRAELDNIQRLLDAVKSEIESRPVADSTVKRDSTSPR